MAVRFKVLAIVLALMAVHSTAHAREWTIVGPRALGMGGAGVAVANDATASYWNPAAYGFFNRYNNFQRAAGEEYGKRKWSTVLNAGAAAQVHEDLGEQVNAVMQTSFDTFDTGTINSADVPDFLNLVNDLKTFGDNDARALTVTPHAGLRVQASHFGIGAFLVSEISAKGDLDLVNVAPVSPGTTFSLDDFTDPANYGCSPCSSADFLTAGQQSEITTHLQGLGWTATQIDNFINAVDNGLELAGVTVTPEVVDQIKTVATLGDASASSGGSLADNESRLLFKGIGIAEFPITYGYAITNDIAVGANLKFMKARVYNTSVDVFDTDFEDALDAATSDYVDSENFGIDLGVLYKPSDRFRLGIVARNVNSPEFDMKKLLPGDSDNIVEEAQVRAGAAVKPWGFLTLALDVDLTENQTTVSGDYASRQIGGGVEVNAWNFLKVRGGAYTNLAEDDIGPVYTAGVGLNLWLVHLDVGAALSQDTTDVDGNDIPEELRLEAALSALF